MKSQNNVYGEDYLSFTTFDPVSNKIIWAIHYSLYQSPFKFAAFRKLRFFLPFLERPQSPAFLMWNMHSLLNNRKKVSIK